MKKLQLRDLACAFALLVLISGACKKKVPPPAPPPPPAPQAAAPSVNMVADPTSIQRGQGSTLRWSSQNASDLVIAPGVDTISSHATQMPGALAELLFITSPADAAWLRDDAARDAMARGLARGVSSFLERSRSGG